MKLKNWQIQIQADDFLKAYQVLRKNNDSASSVVMGPSIVCLAFAVELHLKNLHHVINGQAPRGHNTFKLFEKLPRDIKQKVFDHKSIIENPFMTKGDIFSTQFFSSTYEPYDRFIFQMKRISEGFEKWRYAHEQLGVLSYDSSFALALIKAVASTADSLRHNNKEG